MLQRPATSTMCVLIEDVAQAVTYGIVASRLDYSAMRC